MGDSINSLGLDATSGAYSKYSNTTTDTNKEVDTSYMDFDSYLKLLVAEMSNQDFNDPLKDNEVLQQMSSYSMLEGITNMTNQSNITYATSLVGQAVTINEGGYYESGIIQSVKIYDNEPYIVVNGNIFAYDTVEEITSAEIYKDAEQYLGKEIEAEILNSDGEKSTIKGEVTKIILAEGRPVLIVDDKYSVLLEDVKGVVGEEDKTEGETTKPDDLVEGSDKVTVDSTDYKATTASLYDELSRSIDAINSKSSVNLNSENYSNADLVYGSGEVEIYDSAAGYFDNTATFSEEMSANSSTTQSVETVQTLYANGNETIYVNNNVNTDSYSNSGSLTAGFFDVPLTTSNFNSVVNMDRDKKLSSIISNNQVYTLLNDDRYETRYSLKYGMEVKSDTLPGISNADCVPHRQFADKYPDEAMLADSYGTRMYDIRFINNRAITSIIDTSKAMGTTIDGRTFTDIGFSGVGKLGEVVTFDNGTQRVEIIHENGTSSWRYTSGNYTLDQICSVPGGNYDLSPDECAIRFDALN